MSLVMPEMGLLFWMLVAFLVLLFLLRKFAWKPVMTMIHKREESIDEALKAADRAREEMQLMKADNEKILAEARLEREKIYREAQESKEKILAEAREQAKKEQNRIMDETKSLIEVEKNNAVKAIRAVTADLSVKIAEKLLRQELSDNKAQKDLAERMSNELILN